MSYGLDDRLSIPGRGNDGNFCLRYRVQTGSGSHPASFLMGTEDSLPGVKPPEREVDHSPSSIAEVKDAWSHASIHQYVFMAW
jgi:hypothetical protein